MMLGQLEAGPSNDFAGGGGLAHSGVLAPAMEGCGCALCLSAGAEAAGDGAAGLDGSKPVFTTDQVVGNFLRSNAAWSPGSTIAYSFREAKPSGSDAGLSFVPLSGVERDMTRLGFELVSDLVNLTFVEAPDDFRATGSSNRIYLGKDGALPDYSWGHAVRWTVPTGGRRLVTAAEIVISDAAQATRAWFAGGYNFQALTHEILHTLGIPHPGNYNADGNSITYGANAEYAQDSRQFTVMSYFGAANTGADHQTDGPSGGLWSSTTPLLHDIAALQALYGANTATRSGDTVYGYGSNAGRDLYDFDAAARPITTPDGRTIIPAPIFAIWDGGGRDRLDFSRTNLSVNADLNPGAFSDAFGMTNNISIAFGVVVEDAAGGSADDILVGNSASNRLQGGDGHDQLSGRDGDDRLEGGRGRDTLFGDAGSDLLAGEADDDRLFGQAGHDILGGQDGNDFLDGGEGDDALFGDAGNDQLEGRGGADRLHGQDGDDLMGGQEGDDYLDGDQGRDNLFGDGGNDLLLGGGDADRLHGQDGDDLIGGQDGDDYVDGGPGRDNLFGDAGNDLIVGGRDADRLHGQDGDDLIGGQDGDDYVDGGAGRDNLFGDGGNDLIVGGTEVDRLHGQDGDDLIGGQDGDDYVDGGQGRDNLFGDAGDDLVLGGIDDDRLHGQDGDDRMGGGDGNDYLDGGSGRDNLFGDAGADFLEGRDGDDRLHGQDGEDLIGGQAGRDYLEGGAGRDALYGDDGDDLLFGGEDADLLSGGAGADRFSFTAVSQSTAAQRDRIIDFDARAGDVVDLAGIDADVFAVGDQAFEIVASFTGRPGQAVLSFDGRVSTFLADVNGDGVAEFGLELNGQVDGRAGFLL